MNRPLSLADGPHVRQVLPQPLDCSSCLSFTGVLLGGSSAYGAPRVFNRPSDESVVRTIMSAATPESPAGVNSKSAISCSSPCPRSLEPTFMYQRSPSSCGTKQWAADST